MRRNLFAVLLIWIAALGLIGCQRGSGYQVQPDAVRAAEQVTVDVVCRSEDVLRIFYSCYIDGQERGMGGLADLDGAVIQPGRTFSIPFSQGSFEEGDDLSLFSMTLSPYGEGDVREAGTTDPVAIPAQYGERYTVVLSGDREAGFTAAVEQEET